MGLFKLDGSSQKAVASSLLDAYPALMSLKYTGELGMNPARANLAPIFDVNTLG
jgi:hypothetical protein